MIPRVPISNLWLYKQMWFPIDLSTSVYITPDLVSSVYVTHYALARFQFQIQPDSKWFWSWFPLVLISYQCTDHFIIYSLSSCYFTLRLICPVAIHTYIYIDIYIYSISLQLLPQLRSISSWVCTLLLQHIYALVICSKMHTWFDHCLCITIIWLLFMWL